MRISTFLNAIWKGVFGGLGARTNPVDPESGQTNYGLFVGREERARLESLEAANSPPLPGPLTGDLGMAAPPNDGAR
ncbi:MAG TPA: hypothetical protein VEU27_15740 [Gemmatimonadales bacterium]|nr:hypothetical protein [Gemmatimonadales bacterium]